MSTTATVTQLPIVLADLAEHMIAFGLPPFASLDLTDEIRDNQVIPQIRIYLRGEHTHLPWTASLAIDGEATEPMASGLGQRVEWTARLPRSGARVNLVGFRAVQVVRLAPVAS